MYFPIIKLQIDGTGFKYHSHWRADTLLLKENEAKLRLVD
jgi:hypothetical protein